MTPKVGDLIRTVEYVPGYGSEVGDKLAVVKKVVDNFSEDEAFKVRATLLCNNKDIVLFDGEFTTPEEEQSDEGR